MNKLSKKIFLFLIKIFNYLSFKKKARDIINNHEVFIEKFKNKSSIVSENRYNKLMFSNKKYQKVPTIDL
jgi:hypothetical protein